MNDLSTLIRNVPDFPKKGIIFKDITTLIKDPEAFKEVIDTFIVRYKDKSIAKVVGIESRGFIFASVVAYAIGAGVVVVRKPGKLPAETLSETYELEYGTDSVEIHTDAISKGENVVVIDDLLATGGTLAATCTLVERLEGRIVEVATLIELAFLKGREKIKGFPYFTILSVD